MAALQPGRSGDRKATRAVTSDHYARVNPIVNRASGSVADAIRGRAISANADKQEIRHQPLGEIPDNENPAAIPFSREAGQDGAFSILPERLLRRGSVEDAEIDEHGFAFLDVDSFFEFLLPPGPLPDLLAA